jgi:peptidoglycan endopeptidase LytE
MNKLILITFASVCFLLSTSVLVFSAVSLRVKPGDDMHTRAKKYPVWVEKVKSAKGLKARKLRPGQRIALQEGHKHSKIAKSTRTTTTISEKVENDGEFVEYKVKRGDTVKKVAMKFGIEKGDILESNSNVSRRLSLGRVLLIPRIGESETRDDIVDLPTGTLRPWKTDEERYMLVKVAKSFMGAPYLYGGESVRGLDCSAFVKKIYDIFDVQLPRVARDQYKAGPRISREELSVGDLVFFKTKKYAKYPTHVGIYIGEGNFIHSSSGHAKIGVKIDSLQTDFYNRAYIGAARVKKSSDEGPSDIPFNYSS